MLSKIQIRAFQNNSRRFSNLKPVNIAIQKLTPSKQTLQINCSSTNSILTNFGLKNNFRNPMNRQFSTFTGTSKKNYLNALKQDLKKSEANTSYPKVKINKQTHQAITSVLTKFYGQTKDPIFSKSFDIFESSDKKNSFAWSLESILAVYKLCINLQHLQPYSGVVSIHKA